jgi:hypothetical protein
MLCARCPTRVNGVFDGNLRRFRAASVPLVPIMQGTMGHGMFLARTVPCATVTGSAMSGARLTARCPSNIREDRSQTRTRGGPLAHTIRRGRGFKQHVCTPAAGASKRRRGRKSRPNDGRLVRQPKLLAPPPRTAPLTRRASQRYSRPNLLERKPRRAGTATSTPSPTSGSGPKPGSGCSPGRRARVRRDLPRPGSCSPIAKQQSPTAARFPELTAGLASGPSDVSSQRRLLTSGDQQARPVEAEAPPNAGLAVA